MRGTRARELAYRAACRAACRQLSAQPQRMRCLQAAVLSRVWTCSPDAVTRLLALSCSMRTCPLLASSG